MPVIPGAEPYAADGGRVGVLLVHGFTGSPASMRPWGEYLAAAGLTVRVPRLPGHGTRWQDMNDTRWSDWYREAERGLDELRACCDTVVIGGLSMGGSLCIRLAEQRGPDIDGVILVNPVLTTEVRGNRLLPVAVRVVASMPPVGNDIHKPGVDELAYDRLPTRAALSLQRLWAIEIPDLHKITGPVLVFRSVQDHVVPASSVEVLVAGAVNATLDVRALTESYHVATLDYDAPRIFAESLEFIRERERAGV